MLVRAEGKGQRAEVRLEGRGKRWWTTWNLRRGVAIVALLTASPIAGRADVIEQSERGFVVRNEVVVAAPAREVYRTLTAGIGEWWDPAHTFFGDSANLRLEARAGGCFCERLADGRSVEHLHVVYAEPDRELRMTGALGPLQEMAVAGVMVFRLSENSGRTTVTMQYSVGGYRPGGLGELAAPVDGVLAGQLQRFKAAAERSAGS